MANVDKGARPKDPKIVESQNIGDVIKCLEGEEICYQMMPTVWQFWLNYVCKIFYLDHIRHGDYKIEYSRYLKLFWHATVHVCTFF